MDERSRALRCWHERAEERSEKSWGKGKEQTGPRAAAITVEVSVEKKKLCKSRVEQTKTALSDTVFRPGAYLYSLCSVDSSEVEISGTRPEMFTFMVHRGKKHAKTRSDWDKFPTVTLWP